MGLNELTAKHPKVVYSAASIFLVLCVGFISVWLLSGSRNIRTGAPDYFFSIDDGKTFFRARGSNVAPFDYQGHTAERARVFECGGTQFVGYLEHYKPDARKLVLAGGRLPPSVELSGREFKKPGDVKWESCDSRAAVSRICRVTCPHASNDTPIPIEPE